MKDMLFAESIVKKYAGQAVLNGVGLQAEGGEIIGIAGENGSGKSTLLSVITGILKPDGGQVSIEGAPLSPPTLRKYVGYVPQENSLFDNLSAADNLRLWASAYGVDWRNALPFLFPEGEGITEAGERAFLRKKAGKLSGGMKKRLSISLSLLNNPKYLIMDEPTTGLDAVFRWTLTNLLKQLRSRGQCVIFTSHHTEELLLCDRIYILRGGLFAYCGGPGVLREGGDALYAIISGRRQLEAALC
jgi:ABC-2 type transport system ATP-binding protein